MHYLDMKYANLLSGRLERFKIKETNPYKANFRCPICGDSKKSAAKTRGWLTEHKGMCWSSCFNCGWSNPLSKFLKEIDPTLYNDYIVEVKMEKIGGDKGNKDKEPEPPKKGLDTLDKLPTYRKVNNPLALIKRVSQLKVDHPVRKYVTSRQIPPNKHFQLYYAPKFVKWTNQIEPGLLPDTTPEEPRLILPLLTPEGDMFGYQGRAFDPKSLRYLTVMLTDEYPKIFGLNTVDFNKEYTIVEGPIDSLFLKNSIAMVGADGSDRGLRNTKNGIFCFDNEPRNVEIVKRMEKAISRGHRVCIWPETLQEKDINDMILAGQPGPAIDMLIRERAFSGLRAEFELANWRKC